MAYLNLERVINCSVTEQIVADNIARVTSAWKAPETCGARVVVCRSNVILAQALRSMASELFDADGVPLQKLMSQMHPFEDDGSSPGSFPDRLTLDLLPFMSAPGVILDSCDTILNHISTSFHEMGLDCVPPQGGLSELRVVSSFKLAHSQVPMSWDNRDQSTTFVFVMPFQVTTAVNYVGEMPMDVFGYRKDLRTELHLGDSVVSFGQALYLGREMKQTRELVTSIVVAVYTIDSNVPTPPFTRPNFRAANELAALTGVPPMQLQVCVRCYGEIRDRMTEDLWGSKAIDVGKGSHCSDCREEFRIPAFVCGACESTNFWDRAASDRVKACCLQSAPSVEDPLSEFADGWIAWEVSASRLREGKMPCLHRSLVQNNLGDALMNVLSIDEIRKAAALFKEWYLSGNIVFDMAPSELQEFFKECEDFSFMWPKWREMYVDNSHCSRVVLAMNAVIGALSIGPLVPGVDSSSGKKSKVTKAQPAFYVGMGENDLGELRSRLWVAARISSGLISASEMQRMALKTLRHVQKGAWCTNFKCTCNIQSLDANMSTRRDHNECRGPSLNLAIDQDANSGPRTQQVRSTQARWAEEMKTWEFTRFMAPKPETDHRFW